MADDASFEKDPQSVDVYTVEERLGAGSFGVTYRVTGPDVLEYALKILRSDADNEARLRFLNEKWALKQLDHVAIPKFIAEGTYQGCPYVVQTLAQGTSLRSQFKKQRREGGPSSVARVLSIASAVLQALAHMHKRGILHRDVKDDNIIATPSVSHVSLIDFGFCKGQGQPAEVPSVWNVGAARYAPPSKLEHPTQARETHDVFAVGVVAYLLLTNQYPWDISASEDAGHLRKRMEAHPPEPLTSLNAFVSQQVSDFVVGSLLVLDDRSRPTAEAAYAVCEQLREGLAAQVAPSSIGPARRPTFPRVIRDPLHGDVRLTDFEWEILRSREVQRLRWLRQLGFANLVYPGAEHTRLSHSIGTMHVADRVLRQIEDTTGKPFDPEERLTARLYALLHDVMHIPYGHTLEDELGIYVRHDHNEDRIERLLLSNQSQVGNLLRTTDYGREVLAYFDVGSSVRRHGHIRELIEGPTGADVLDYIDRDSFSCGLDHRVDSAIFRRYSIVQARAETAGERHIAARLFGTHGIRLDAEFAIESLFLERYALFLKVYTHPAKTAAGAMLGKAFLQAASGRKPELVEKDVEWMGDDVLVHRLAQSKKTLCRRLAEQILFRELFKAAFRAPILDPEQRHHNQYKMKEESLQKAGLLDPTGRGLAEQALAKRAGVDVADIAIYCSKPPGLQKIEQFVEPNPGDAERRDEVYRPYLRTYERHLGLWTAYVFTSLNTTTREFEAVGEAAEDLFMLKNQLSSSRRQGTLF